jgi:hypothetical protein
MMGDLHSHLTRELIDDRLRVAGERRRPDADAPSAPIGSASNIHKRQVALVCASLLLSRRRDSATHRRA